MNETLYLNRNRASHRGVLTQGGNKIIGLSMGMSCWSLNMAYFCLLEDPKNTPLHRLATRVEGSYTTHLATRTGPKFK